MSISTSIIKSLELEIGFRCRPVRFFLLFVHASPGFVIVFIRLRSHAHTPVLILILSLSLTLATTKVVLFAMSPKMTIEATAICVPKV